MDLQSSQPCSESVAADRRRTGDESAVMREQHRAAEKAGSCSTRSFRREEVVIETVHGERLRTRMWVSDQEPTGVAQKVADVFRCEVCGKEFDKKQKMLLHARFHKS